MLKDRKIEQALVIGGSGMLAGLAFWLSQQSNRVYVTGRNQIKLQRLADKNKTIVSLVTEHKDSQRFAANLETIKGNLDLVVAWIHTDAQNALDVLIRNLEGRSGSVDLYIVEGSRSKSKAVASSAKIKCHTIRLGFVIEDGNSRWLTDEEISNGLITAILSNEANFIVGQIEPVEKTPH